MEQAAGDNIVAAKKEPTGFWPKYGCFIWIVLPFVLAIPVWLVAFPESYDRAVDFVVDALTVECYMAIAAVLARAIVRSRKTVRPVGYLVGLAAIALAGLLVWNLAALYTRAGTSAVTTAGWEFSARPAFYGLVVFGGLVVTALIWGRFGPGGLPSDGK